MHTYSLYYPVQAECQCCRVVTEFTFKSKHDHVVCKGCIRHQGDSPAVLQLRDTDHVGLWQSEVALVAEAADSREAALQQEIDRLKEQLERRGTDVEDLRETVRRGVAEAPLAAVEKWLHSEEVMKAHGERDRAYRARDRLFQALWALDQMHGPGEGDPHQCACDRRLSRCREAQALAPIVDALTRWEKDQIDRLRRDLSCALPEQHPEWNRAGRRPRSRYA